MNTQPLGTSDLQPSRIMYGCAKLGGTWDRSPADAGIRARALTSIRAAVDAGITHFDHADIYCMGKSEAVFAEALAELRVERARIILQSKCGTRFANDPAPGDPARYDYSRAHILGAVDGILQRLRTGYIDVLLLHRPDALVEPDEVASAFDTLHAAGKVRWFGVSNHSAGQIELLRRSLRQPLVVNQLQLSLIHHHLIDSGVSHNQGRAALSAEGTLDYCRLHDITVQAWGPLANGKAIGAPGNGDALGTLVSELAARKQVAPEAIALAWLLRHPARIQPVIGSGEPARIAAAASATQVDLSREEWYALFTAARGGAVS